MSYCCHFLSLSFSVKYSCFNILQILWSNWTWTWHEYSLDGPLQWCASNAIQKSTMANTEEHSLGPKSQIWKYLPKKLIRSKLYINVHGGGVIFTSLCFWCIFYIGHTGHSLKCHHIHVFIKKLSWNFSSSSYISSHIS
jgi:hypothetical protein